jgi:hypothetical protein
MSHASVNGTVLCLSSYEKGAGVHPRGRNGRAGTSSSMTSEELRHAGWPRDCIDEFFVMSDTDRARAR